MKIAIDCRLIFQTGVGRYIRAILEELKKEAPKKPEHEYVVIVLKGDEQKIGNFPQNVKIVNSQAKWHSVREQIEIPQILSKYKIDLVHFPYFNVPIFLSTKFIVTIHDLTINKFKTGKATSLPKPVFVCKKIAYLFTIWFAIIRSLKIITVSETVKKEIIKTYKVEEEKIKVIYNGSELEEYSGEQTNKIHPHIRIDDNSSAGHLKSVDYILYVGNLHPHKNIETLILSYDYLIKQDKFKDLRLVIVSPFDFFYARLFNFIKKLGLEKRIDFLGNVNNYRLASLYKNARAFVFPSYSEGFGIPGVEAMRFGCPVVASDIPVFHEIYGEAAVYFSPKNALDLSEKIALSLLNTNLRSKLYLNGIEQSQKYSWVKMGIETLKEYESCIGL